MNSRNREDFLVQVMNKGFDRAATSFSKLINRIVKILNIESILIHTDDDFSYLRKEHGELHILTTNIIGKLSGKSFLIFNSNESQEVFRALNASVSNQTLLDAILLEIDNIISASVISELANAMNLQIHGASPQLTKINSKYLNDFMSKEMISEEPSSIIFCVTTFQFDGQERVHPQFIWKFSNQVFEMIPQRITA